MLEKISCPADIKSLSQDELISLAQEIREEILSTVSTNGGHLASNLGIVETTIALFDVFNLPGDHIIYDVGHQCYAHKILTGRKDSFSTLRKGGGISGFTNPDESPFDTVFSGHSGTALSVGLGMAQADAEMGNDHWTICIIGDGSMTNGMVFEALNNCLSSKKLRLLIILNDNEMSISPNVGGLSSYLTRVRTSRKYYTFKRRLEKALTIIPGVGIYLASFARQCKDLIKRMTRQKTVFENLGIPYLGAVDGNQLFRLEEVLQEAKRKDGLCLVHVLTKKGKGYEPAEEEPSKYHSVGPFDREKGVDSNGSQTFSDVFGNLMVKMAEEDPAVFGVSAAMCEGTGLGLFAQKFPNRFFDVGIAEEHAIGFSAGLSLAGKKPICVLYSTFAQRVYDQLFQEVCLQRIPFLLALDRAGFVAGDGRTHQGIFDVALFSSLPNIEIWSPDSFKDLENQMRRLIGEKKQAVIRYSKGNELPYQRELFDRLNPLFYTWIQGEFSSNVIITYGRVTAHVCEAIELAGIKDFCLIQLQRIIPLPGEEILPLLRSAKRVLLVEEGVEDGGVCQLIEAFLSEKKIRCFVKKRGVKNQFLPQASLNELYEMTGLSSRSLSEWFKED